MDIMDRLERYANTPKWNGHYPSDAECDAYERELFAGLDTAPVAYGPETFVTGDETNDPA